MLCRTALTINRSGTAVQTIRQRLKPAHSSRWCSTAEVCEDCEDCDCFRKFGVERTFSVPMEELKSTYKKLMTELHPDRHTMKTAEERDVMNEEASVITRCYDVVSNPQSRALYLLEKMGRPVDEHDTGSLVGSTFLMDIMELREQIDDTTSDSDLQQLFNENKNRMAELYLGLGDAFEENDLDEARRLTAELQYWTRAEETIREKISSLE